MISEQHKLIINAHLTSAVSIKTGTIYPNDDFDKYIRKIKDLQLSKFIPSDELDEYLKQRLVANNCSDYAIQEFFRWKLNV